MNAYLNSLDYTLWYSVLILEVAIIGFILVHKHYLRYPAFAAYIAISLIKTVTLMYVAAHCSVNSYGLTYWTLAAVKIGFLVAVGIEIFGVIFKPLNTLPPGTALRMFLIVLLLAVLMIGAFNFFPASSPHPLQSFFRTLERTATFFVLLAVSLVLLQSEITGIPKNMKVYGISLGLLFTLSIDAATFIVSHSYQRPIYMGAFTISGIIWLYYFSQPEPKFIPPTREQLEKLEQIVNSLLPKQLIFK